MKKSLICTVALSALLSGCVESSWLQGAFRKTDFTKKVIDLKEIETFGNRFDQQNITQPAFAEVSEVTGFGDSEPLVSLVINGEARAYPITFLATHIVNDTVAGKPVLVSFCTVCSSANVFDRRVGDKVLTFGSAGYTRKSDQILYDRQTETLWQKLDGQGLVGEYAGQTLNMLPARIESFKRFKKRYPEGKIMLAPFARRAGFLPDLPDNLRRNTFAYLTSNRYGITSNAGSDNAGVPLFFRGSYDPTAEGNLKGTTRVIIVDGVPGMAWALPYLKDKGKIEHKEYVITWSPGMSSPTGKSKNTAASDLGNIVVQKKGSDDKMVDVAYDFPYIAVFKSFNPDGIVVRED